MDRAAYNDCMRPYITGSKPKEQRKLDFCVGAKRCSGKASTREEAEEICRQPKPPKLPKQVKARGQNPSDIAKCVIGHIHATQTMSLEEVVTKAIKECVSQ